MDQILAVTEVAITVPQLSGSVSHASQLSDSPTEQIAPAQARAVQRRVYAILEELMLK